MPLSGQEQLRNVTNWKTHKWGVQSHCFCWLRLLFHGLFCSHPRRPCLSSLLQLQQDSLQVLVIWCCQTFVNVYSGAKSRVSGKFWSLKQDFNLVRATWIQNADMTSYDMRDISFSLVDSDHVWHSSTISKIGSLTILNSFKVVPFYTSTQRLTLLAN